MSERPLSIPERLDKLDKRMQRIEDAITAKGIKFIKKNEDYDWLLAPEVAEYVFELIGIKRTWRIVYNWINLGLMGAKGKRVYLEYSTFTDGKFFVRKLWVRKFLDKVRRGSV